MLELAMASGNSALRGRRLAAWQVYAISVGLIVVALGTPWVVRWSGWLRGEPPAVAEVREARVRVLRPVMLELPGGEFMMGSPEDEEGREDDEGPQHPVAISRFQMCQTEVTQGQYEAVMGSNPSDCDHGCGDDLPVQNVSWYGAIMYLNRLTEIENARRPEGAAKLTVCYEEREEQWIWRQGCDGYRLPTEAEWEYAARAGSTTRYYFGDDESELAVHAWYIANARSEAHAVGTAGAPAHPWFLRDMHGNVWEWVWDRFTRYEASAEVMRDLRGPSDGDPTIEGIDGERVRVSRGGGFGSEPEVLRSAVRNWGTPHAQIRDFGFRCARDAPRALP